MAATMNRTGSACSNKTEQRIIKKHQQQQVLRHESKLKPVLALPLRQVTKCEEITVQIFLERLKKGGKRL